MFPNLGNFIKDIDIIICQFVTFVTFVLQCETGVKLYKFINIENSDKYIN